MKKTIEINDDLQERIDNAIDELKELIEQSASVEDEYLRLEDLDASGVEMTANLNHPNIKGKCLQIGEVVLYKKDKQGEILDTFYREKVRILSIDKCIEINGEKLINADEVILVDKKYIEV